MAHVVSGGSGSTSLTPVNYRYSFIFIIVFGGSFLIFFINYESELQLFNQLPQSSWGFYRNKIVSSDEEFTIKTKGCSIPSLDPLDNTIKDFVAYPKDIKPCLYKNHTFLNNNKTHIWVNTKHLRFYNISNKNSFTCCYRSFCRPRYIDDITSASVDSRVKYEDCIYFTDIIRINDEFVRVSCINSKKIQIYEQFYLKAVKKPTRAESSSNKTVYNVIVMGIDAVSRLNFHRTMPKTLEYIKNRDAIELLGYNKVGDNTFPNLMPMLLGIKDIDLKKTCLPNKKSTFDNCPFVWEWYKEAGFFTALGEDTSGIGTFNWIKSGFSGNPTDYYLHTFINEAEKYVGNNKDFNSRLCMSEKYFYQVLLDYVEDLLLILKTNALFGFFWEITMSHDYLNYPMLMDESYNHFFQRLEASNCLNNTIFFLVSDHGIRWGDIRSTKQGHLEERLPFVYILLPQTFRDSYNEAYNNLRVNSKRLTTPFDIHETLLDLIDIDKIKNANITARSRTQYAQDRGISLFLPIPSNRTCKLAHIDDHWCTCHRGVKLSSQTKEAQGATKYLIKYLNMMLDDHTQCAQLELVKVIDVIEMEVNAQNDDGVWRDWREFKVTIQTRPGDGIFEATLRYENKKWSLSGTVSRLNLYGDQSRCINDSQLKLYCYCL